MHALLALSRFAIVASLAAVATAGSEGAIVAALIAGAFMLANTLLTVYLTRQLTRRDEAARRRRRRR